MAISEEEFQKEKKILSKINKLLGNTLSELGQDVIQSEEDLVEFKKMMWENANSFDSGEEQQVMYATALEADKAYKKQQYFKRLCKIKDKPYFASIVFKDDEDNANRVTKILINGIESKFDTVLKNGAVVMVKYGYRPTINEEWLKMVTSNYAKMRIKRILDI